MTRTITQDDLASIGACEEARIAVGPDGLMLDDAGLDRLATFPDAVAWGAWLIRSSLCPPEIVAEYKRVEAAAVRAALLAWGALPVTHIDAATRARELNAYRAAILDDAIAAVEALPTHRIIANIQYVKFADHPLSVSWAESGDGVSRDEALAALRAMREGA